MNQPIIDQQVTKEILENISYGDLKAKFEELGIPSAWKAGKNKTILIETALSMLHEIRESMVSKRTTDEIIGILTGKDQLEDETRDRPLQKELNEDQLEESDSSSHKANEVLSLEVLKKSLSSIEKNLMNGLLAQRPILLKKKEMLLELIIRTEEDLKPEEE